jgi:hypothetical protein
MGPRQPTPLFRGRATQLGAAFAAAEAPTVKLTDRRWWATQPSDRLAQSAVLLGIHPALSTGAFGGAPHRHGTTARSPSIAVDRRRSPSIAVDRRRSFGRQREVAVGVSERDGSGPRL